MDNKKDLILDLLKEERGGLTISQISYRLGISRITVLIYLRELIGEGKVVERVVGRSKLYYYHKFFPGGG